MKRAAIFILLITAFILSGCVGVAKKDKISDTAGLIEPQASTKFSDIPVPMGFKFLPQKSYSFNNSGVRVALLKYEGKADAEQVVNFYREQMSMYNWQLLNIVEFGERMLNFDREQETCIITLVSRGSRDTLITIAIGPKAQSAKKEARVVK